MRKKSLFLIVLAAFIVFGSVVPFVLQPTPVAARDDDDDDKERKEEKDDEDGIQQQHQSHGTRHHYRQRLFRNIDQRTRTIEWKLSMASR